MPKIKIDGTIGNHLVSLTVTMQEDAKSQSPVEEKVPSLKQQLGKHCFDGSYVKDLLHVAYSSFENAVSVTIYETHETKQKTLYTQNFFQNRDMALHTIEDVLAGAVDVEDLIFQLKEIKDQETN